eukprot:6211980-Pleurochrysis_carterae.AAC.3
MACSELHLGEFEATAKAERERPTPIRKQALTNRYGAVIDYVRQLRAEQYFHLLKDQEWQAFLCTAA